MKGVRQTVGHHGVLQGGVAHLHARSHVHGVRRLCVHNSSLPARSLRVHTLGGTRGSVRVGVYTLLMFSMPPATTTVDSPAMMD